jgi:hypothetical protein
MINTLLQRLNKLIQPARIEQLAKDHGWCQRRAKISGFEFFYSGALGQASALELTLNAQATCLSQTVTRQAVDQRYNPAAVEFFKAVFEEALAGSLDGHIDSAMAQALHQRFGAIRLFDSTQCPCSQALDKIFPGCGGGGSGAGLKVLLSYDYSRSQLQPLAVLAAKRSDQGLAEAVAQQVGRGELGIWDKGFYKAQALRQLAARGGYFLLPWSRSVSVWQLDAAGQRTEIDMAAQLKSSSQACVDWPAVELGQTQDSRLGPVRLVAYRLTQEKADRRRAQLREKCRTYGRQPTEQALELAGWLILMTNVPAQLLPTAALGYLYRVRWQVELLFKQWKSVLRLDAIPSQNACRVQCEVWARLLAALLASVWHQHANAACLQLHQREISFSKLAKQLQQHGQLLVQALFANRAHIESVFRSIWKKILKLARKEHQPSRPTTWQNLCSHWLELLPVAAVEPITPNSAAQA